jgi:hypothetical protein
MKTKFKFEDLPKPIQTRLTKLSKALMAEDLLENQDDGGIVILEYAIEWITSQNKVLKHVNDYLSDNGYPLY